MADQPTTVQSTGKRKTAIARVFMKHGSGTISINGRSLEGYFPREAHQILVRKPLEDTEVLTRYDVIASIKGGGPTGQAGALRHGIARAIERMEPGQRQTLKRAGFLTRDARKKERKKYGQRGARARFQFSKR